MKQKESKVLLKLELFLRSQIRRSPFTITGRLLTVACLFCLFAIVDFRLVPLLSHVIWLLIVGFGAGFLFRPRLKVESVSRPVAFSRQDFEFQLIVTNVGRFGAYDLQFDLELPPKGLWSDGLTKSVGSISPGQSTKISYTLTPTQRGVFEIKRLTVASLFPLSLFRFLASHRLEQTVYVAPSYTEHTDVVADIVGQVAQSEFAGIAQRNSLLEYIGSREYRPGVPVRRWDFSSWARLGIPSVREFSEGSDGMVIIVVDTTRRTKAIDQSLESALSTSAGILMQCAQRKQSTMLISVAKEIEFGRVLTGEEQCEESLMRLAAIEGERASINWLKVWDDVLLETSQGATLVAILSDPMAHALLAQQDDGRREIVSRLMPSANEARSGNAIENKSSSDTGITPSARK